MEPENVTPHSNRDAALETLLRRAAPPLPDNGFSARVVAALPRVRRAGWSRFWLCAVGGISGLALVWTQGPSWTDLQPVVAQLTGTYLAAGTPVTAFTLNPSKVASWAVPRKVSDLVQGVELQVEGKDSAANRVDGTVTMILDAGAWRLDKEDLITHTK